jgi:hypothetical protein
LGFCIFSLFLQFFFAVDPFVSLIHIFFFFPRLADE